MSDLNQSLRRVKTAALSCGVLALCLTAAHAQSFTVTSLTKNTATKASYPAMVADANGNLNLAWVDNTKGIQFVRSTNSASGTSFGTPPTPTTVPGSNGPALPAFQPQIAVYMTQPNVVEIVWAATDPASATLYDIFASRSESPGTPNFTTTRVAGPVALFDTPRLAFDFSGKTNIVWGQHDVFIAQAQDGLNFGASPTSLIIPGTPTDTGGPRIAVSSDNHVFVVWTDESSKANMKPGDGNYCGGETLDASGTTVTNTFGGNFWVNEIFPASTPGGAVVITFANTRNLSVTDWKSVNAKFPNGFFGCSYDNLTMFADKVGLIHLLWSDDQPLEDVLTSEPHGTDANGFRTFSFPINLANVPAASPKVAVDSKGSFYVVWSGGPTGGSNSQGIYFTRSDDGGSTFTTQSCPAALCPAINIATKGAIAPAFPQIAVDSNSNVNIVWEQATAALKYDGSDMFNVFFARSTDRGNTFPTVLQVSSNPSVFCFKPAPPPESLGASPGTATPTTPDVSTCGTAQLGLDGSSTPGVAWLNQASGSTVADINFAMPTFPTASISPTSATLSASNPSQNFKISMNPGAFSGSLTLSCQNADTHSALPSWLTCAFSPQTLNLAQGNTDTLTVTRTGTPTTSMFVSGPPLYAPMAWAFAFVVVSLLLLAITLVHGRLGSRVLVTARGVAVMGLMLVLAVSLVSCGGTTSTTNSSTTTTAGATTGSSGTGTSGGTGGNSVTVNVAVLAQSGTATPATLGTVTITAQ